MISILLDSNEEENIWNELLIWQSKAWSYSERRNDSVGRIEILRNKTFLSNHLDIFLQEKEIYVTRLSFNAVLSLNTNSHTNFV